MVLQKANQKQAEELQVYAEQQQQQQQQQQQARREPPQLLPPPSAEQPPPRPPAVDVCYDVSAMRAKKNVLENQIAALEQQLTSMSRGNSPKVLSKEPSPKEPSPKEPSPKEPSPKEPSPKGP